MIPHSYPLMGMVRYFGSNGLHVLGSRVPCPGLKGYVGVHGVLCPGLKGYVGVHGVLQGSTRNKSQMAPNEKVRSNEKLGLRAKHRVKLNFVIVEIVFLQKV